MDGLKEKALTLAGDVLNAMTANPDTAREKDAVAGILGVDDSRELDRDTQWQLGHAFATAWRSGNEAEDGVIEAALAIAAARVNRDRPTYGRPTQFEDLRSAIRKLERADAAAPKRGRSSSTLNGRFDSE